MHKRAGGGPVGPILIGALGAAGLAALTLALGGGLFLALLAYSLGGAVLLLGAATVAVDGPVAARRMPRAPARLMVLQGLRDG